MIKLRFTWHKRIGIPVTHVDDFLHWRTQELLETVIASIERIYGISSQATGSFTFVGLNVSQCVDEIDVYQAAYIDHLQSLCVDETSPNDRLLIEEERTQLKSAGGQLAWVTGHTTRHGI